MQMSTNAEYPFFPNADYTSAHEFKTLLWFAVMKTLLFSLLTSLGSINIINIHEGDSLQGKGMLYSFLDPLEQMALSLVQQFIHFFIGKPMSFTYAPACHYAPYIWDNDLLQPPQYPTGLWRPHENLHRMAYPAKDQS